MLDRGADQAAGLRALRAAQGAMHLMAIPVEGGADAGWIADLARALRALGARPVVLDASRGRVVRAFGLRPRYELMDLLEGARDFDAVAAATGDGVYVLRADRGLEAFVASGAPAQRLFAGFAGLSQGFDVLLLAMPSPELACLADPGEVVPVIAVPADDDGMARAYAQVKDLARRFGYSRFAAAVRTPSGSRAGQGVQGARGACTRLATVARSFLGADIRFAGRLAEGGADLADLAQNLLHATATPLVLH